MIRSRGAGDTRTAQGGAVRRSKRRVLGLSRATTRDQREDRDDERDDQQQPEETVERGAAGDREDDQRQNEEPKKRAASRFRFFRRYNGNRLDLVTAGAKADG